MSYPNYIKIEVTIRRAANLLMIDHVSLMEASETIYKVSLNKVAYNDVWFFL